MSLRAFHIIFITITTLFSIAVAVWSLYFNAQTNDIVIKIMGWTCTVSAIALPIYGTYFYKKSNQQQLTQSS